MSLPDDAEAKGGGTTDRIFLDASRSGIAYLLKRSKGIVVPGAQPAPVLVGKGFREPRPTETVNHNDLGIDVFLVGALCSQSSVDLGIRANVDWLIDQREQGHMSWGPQDEALTRSHPAQHLSGQAMRLLLSILANSPTLEAETIAWWRGNHWNNLQHRVPAGTPNPYAKRGHKPPRRVVAAGARDPGNVGTKQAAHIPVDLSSVTDYVTSWIENDEHLNVPDGIDSDPLWTSIWAFNLIDQLRGKGWVRHALAGVTAADKLPFRYGYRLTRGKRGHLGEWLGDLATMYRPAKWAAVDYVTGREAYGVPPDMGELEKPTPAVLARKPWPKTPPPPTGGITAWDGRQAA